MSAQGIPKPPRHLSAPARRWWANVVETFELDQYQLRTLTLAAEASDRTEQAREILAKDGVIVADRFGQSKPHPAVAIERDSRISYARLVRELMLDDADPDLRPPRRGRRS